MRRTDEPCGRHAVSDRYLDARWRFLIVLPVVASVLATLGGHGLAGGQETLERTPGMSAGWVAYPGLVHANLPFRFAKDEGGGSAIVGLPTFDLGVGLPWNTLLGLRFAPESPTVTNRANEWELYGRYAPISEAHGNALTVASTVAYNDAARSLDGELTLARWFGPVRAIGVFRTLNHAYDSGDARLAFGAGAVVHPLRGRAPIALAADITAPTDLDDDERAAWQAAIQIGLSFTDHTLSLFATNTTSSTLQGRSRGDDRVRYGFEMTIPIPVGRFLGWYADREDAMAAVVPEPEQAQRVVNAEITRYLFAPKRIEVAAGTTIEWTNTDDVVHTVSADDAAWDSGAIPPGETWRARFDQPGRYPFHCGPHPFMKGVVIVR